MRKIIDISSFDNFTFIPVNFMLFEQQMSAKKKIKSDENYPKKKKRCNGK